MNNNIPMQLINMINGGNPQQVIMNLLRQGAGNNMILNNALKMAESGDAKGIESLARNMCKERGLNPEDMMNELRRNLRI